MSFGCDKCGLCCQHIDQIPELKKFDSGNGRCIHLTENNLCDIYNVRPNICNVEKMYQLRYSAYMSKEEYLSLNEEGCKRLKRLFADKK